MTSLVHTFLKWIRKEPRTVHLHHTSSVGNRAAVFGRADYDLILERAA